MVGRVALVAVVVLAMGLSGCTDAEPIQETGSDVAGTKGAGMGADADAAAARPTPVDSVEEAFAWDGQVGNLVAACAVVTCVGVVPPGSWDHVYDVRGWHGADLTMSWESVAGARMGVGIVEDDCDQDCDWAGFAIGTSPLRLSVDGLDPDDKYILVAWHAYEGIGLAGVQAGTETPFHVEGTILVE